MKRLKIYFNLMILTIIVLLSGCEQTVENPELPYKEQLVIRAVLEAGKPVDNIEITRTLPLLESYSIDKALVKDANAVIKVGDTTYTLIFDNYSEKYKCESLIPEVGKKYFLEVKSKNITATAWTIIPEQVEPDKFSYKRQFIETNNGEWSDKFWEYRIFAEYKPQVGASYLSASGYDNDIYRNYSYEIKRSKDTMSNGKISQEIFSYTTYDTSNFEYDIKYYWCSIDAFDSQFYYYYITRWEGNSGDDIFGTTGLNVRGNIIGGIGVFIGTNPGRITKIKF
jgi:hypothetical protein